MTNTGTNAPNVSQCPTNNSGVFTILATLIKNNQVKVILSSFTVGILFGVIWKEIIILWTLATLVPLTVHWSGILIVRPWEKL